MRDDDPFLYEIIDLINRIDEIVDIYGDSNGFDVHKLVEIRHQLKRMRDRL